MIVATTITIATTTGIFAIDITFFAFFSFFVVVDAHACISIYILGSVNGVKKAKNQRERKIKAAAAATTKEIEQTNQQQHSKQQALQRVL